MVVAPKDGRTDCPRIDVTMDDHPLSINPESKWQTFFKDNEVLLQIDKDVRYTLNNFCTSACLFSVNPLQDVKKAKILNKLKK